MEKRSILFKSSSEDLKNNISHDVLRDLELDGLIDRFIRDYNDSFLEEIYKTPLKNKEEILYRQEIFKDLEQERLFEAIDKFIQMIRVIDKKIDKIENLELEAQKDRRFLEVIEEYLLEIKRITNIFNKIDLKSEGLIYIKNILNECIESDNFNKMFKEGKEIEKELDKIEYVISIKGLKVSLVSSYIREEEKFKEEEEEIKSLLKPYINKKEDYTYTFDEKIEMGSLEKKILSLIRNENKEIFNRLNIYKQENDDFINDKIRLFYKEIRFYISYLDFIKRFNKLNFTYPKISENKEIYGKNIFSLSLADKNIYDEKEIVSNDFYLENNERIFIIWGPNSGGKTTFAKTFGQIHYLSSLGGKVQGTDNKLFLWKEMFTHFGRAEKVTDLKSMLEKDVNKAKEILKNITKDSIIILNELFSSTALEDGIILGGKVIEEIVKKDCFCIYVTFIKELSEYPKTVSLISSISGEKRTYKIERKSSLNQAYAMDIVKKYNLNYEKIKERVLND